MNFDNFVVLVLILKLCLVISAIQQNCSDHKSHLHYGFDLLFTSVDEEIWDYECSIVGNIPAWLNGTLIRNGPGKFETSERRFTHVFDGFAKLHSFTFGKDKTTIQFSSHFINTISYTESVKKNTFYPTFYFGDVDPPFSTMEKIRAIYNAVFDSIENTNINVFDFGSDIALLSDSWPIYSFNRKLPDDIRKVFPELPTSLPVFHSNVAPVVMSVAHPLHDYFTNDVITLAITDTFLPLLGASINVIRARSLRDRELIATIPVARGNYMHSFALTKQYVVLFADPVYVNAFALLTHGTVLKALEMIPDEKTTVYIVSLRDGNVRSLELESSVFHAHHINAYEEGSQIHIDVNVIESIDSLKQWNLDVLRNASKRQQIYDIRPILKRYMIDLDELSINEKEDPFANSLSNRMDLPVINENYCFIKYCYIYGVLFNSDQTDFASMSLVKRDLCNGNDQIWNRQNHYPSEPTFVPNPNRTSEDDGVLISVVLDGRGEFSYVLILDALTMMQIGEARTPIRVPFTIHGRLFT